MNMVITRRRSSLIGIVCILVVVAAACSKRAALPVPVAPQTAGRQLPRLGFSIQVGAFSHVENAARLSEALRKSGYPATYLAAKTDLYKVRFGDFASRKAALRKAQELKLQRVIEEFYIVKPEEYAAGKHQILGADFLRDEIVKTAHSFLGLPYLWGGSAADSGFDCSGLAMAIYQINGLNLPRSSAQQHQYGIPAEKERLRKGDLVFFSNSVNGKINHVGIYIGNDQFIHAPGRGKKIRKDHLSLPYFHAGYRGARSYF